MRFVEKWDASMLRMLRQAEEAAGHPRVVLSTYPPAYQVRRLLLSAQEGGMLAIAPPSR